MKINYSKLLMGLAVLILVSAVGVVWKRGDKDKKSAEYVTVAILAKDKAHTLPLYLTCLEQQTWPAERTYLYIRTNNNNDNTASILRQWVDKVKDRYAGVYFDDKDVEELVQNYKQHEWNPSRFKVLGKIRQDSVAFAEKNHSHYFVADCDNFIRPHTIEKLVDTHLPIVAPFLRVADSRLYSNYHAAIDPNGYYADSVFYNDILSRRLKGLIELPVVHCTYLIRNDILDQINYDDGSSRYEYVIFSDNARKRKIPQYLDNRELYGRITFTETAEEFEEEPWLVEFRDPKNKITSVFTQLYRTKYWGVDAEGNGTSGEGSLVRNTKEYRAFLESFLKDTQTHSVVDAGCGDWQFSQLIDWTGIDYTGYDAVNEVIARNIIKFSTPSIRFASCNILEADLPKADLLLCKEVLQHLSNEDILSFLPQLKKFKHALITNDITANFKENLDTQAGGYRPLDLTKAPFYLKGKVVLDYVTDGFRKQVLYVSSEDL